MLPTPPSKIHMCVAGHDTLVTCDCKRRHKALNLLRVCKQVYEEAAKVWYANNTVCLRDGYEPQDYLEKLPSKHKKAIRAISIMGTGLEQDSCSYKGSLQPKDGLGSVRTVWTSLRECTNLRRLEIRPEHIRARYDDLWASRSKGCKEIFMVICVYTTERARRLPWQQQTREGECV
jgi:hypothetical protein